MSTNYKEKTNRVRREVLDLIYKAQTSHIGSNLSIIDVATVLYDKINLPSSSDPNRDRVIWSKGWAAATAYVLLKDKGILHDVDLRTYGADGGLLGLVESATPGIEASTGSMGHGLPIGVGMALAAKYSASPWRTYVIMSDGEMGCGTTWESALLAAHHKLDNLIVIVDWNQWQAMGRTADILQTNPISDKWKSFGWAVHMIDGHNFDQIEHVILKQHSGMPTIIIADTLKGKGVSVMEDKLEWHYKNIDKDTYELAMQENA